VDISGLEKKQRYRCP